MILKRTLESCNIINNNGIMLVWLIFFPLYFIFVSFFLFDFVAYIEKRKRITTKRNINKTKLSKLK